MKENTAKELLEKYRNGTCSSEECALVEAWYAVWNETDENPLSNEQLEMATERILKRLPGPEAKTRKISWRRTAVAASLVLIGAAGWFWLRKPEPVAKTAHHIYQNDVAPGGNKAFLILANGKKISLTGSRNGELIAQSGIKVVKIAEGELAYEVSEKAGAGEKPVYHTIQTPKGGQYQVRLPDGTRVWLNAASALKFPSSFSSLKERSVELKGEAYFEVAHQKNAFRVHTGQQTVEVLGTHFNINGYEDEPAVKTTLLEGSVRVSSGTEGISKHFEILRPGQQAALINNGFKVTEVDTEAIVAWKNGDFIFKNEDFGSAMRKVSRWYDVEIVYQLRSPVNIQPGGWISRKNNISAVLEMIESTGKVHFKIEGRRVIVENN